MLEDSDAVVLAAAGENGDIKLIDVGQSTCYAQLEGHDQCTSLFTGLDHSLFSGNVSLSGSDTQISCA